MGGGVIVQPANPRGDPAMENVHCPFDLSERAREELTILEMEMALPSAVDAKEVYGNPYGRVIEICLQWFFCVGEILMTKKANETIVAEKFFVLKENKDGFYIELPLKNISGLCGANEKSSPINLILPKEIFYKMGAFSYIFDMKNMGDVLAQSIALMKLCLNEKRTKSSFYKEAPGEIEEQYFPFWETTRVNERADRND